MKYILAVALGLSVLGVVTALGFSGARHATSAAQVEAIAPLDMMATSKGLEDETVREAF